MKGWNPAGWCGGVVRMLLAILLIPGALSAAAQNPAPFEYVDAHIAFYPPKDAPGLAQEAPARMQLPVSPEESLKHMQLPEGFSARLYAAEPDIRKVLAMTWDEQGRLWVAESVDYPNNLKPPPLGQDRIKICEDTDHDGRADKFTVFADQLSIPTGLIFANGGLIVAQAPDTLFLQDTNGDDVADVRRVLFTGWGTEDTHSGPSNLRLGLDNWIWGTVGYSGFDGEVGSEALKFRMGVIRFKPDGSKLEFISSTTNNTWGLGLSETGDVFVSTANGDHMDYMAIPNRYYESVGGYAGRGTAAIFDHEHIHPITDKVRQVDWHGKFTAAAGAALYTARAYPETYWNRIAFVCEPTGHLIHQCVLEPVGSSFVAKDGGNLLASADEWTAPVAAEVGPDGMVWVSDWYNYIVQHNPTPQGFENGPGNAYITPLRDKTHGRIYRIVHGDGGDEVPDLSDASTEALIASLGHSNLFWRSAAQRLLVARGDSTVAHALIECVQNTDLDAIGNAPAALHALAVLDGMGLVETASDEAKTLLAGALQHPAPAVRRQAARLAASIPTLAQEMVPVLDDPDAGVRLAVLLALSEMDEDFRAGTQIARLLAALDEQAESWIPQAALIAGARHTEGFLSGISTFHYDVGVSEAVTDAVNAVADHYARTGDYSRLAEYLGYFAGSPDKVETACLTGLAGGWPADSPPEHTDALRAALSDLDQHLTSEQLLPALSLAKIWGMESAFAHSREALVDHATGILVDSAQTDDARILAATQLAHIVPGPESRAAILAQVGIDASPALTGGLLQALGEDGSPDTAQTIIERVHTMPPKAQSQAIDTLLTRVAWSRAFLQAIGDGAIERPAFNVVQKRQLLDSPDETLREQAKSVLLATRETTSPDREALVQRLLPLVTQNGNPALGKQVFAENCITCHRFDGEGGTIAPDLTGIAGGNRVEILTAIVDPNRSVEANFRQWTAEMNDGLLYSGLLAEESQTSIVIYNALGQPQTLLREDIEQLTMSALSVMPEGFESLPEDAIAGLIEYLVTGSAYAPLDMREAANTISTVPMFTGSTGSDPYQNRLVFETWGRQVFDGVPYTIIDPEGTSVPNAIMLRSPHSPVVKARPLSATVPCNRAATAIHLLSGVSGWGYPFGEKGSTTMIVRLHYGDGETEDHPLLNGIHFADYIREIEVPESRLAFNLGGRQLRQLTLKPARTAEIREIEFLKGPDDAAPVVMAVTVELPHGG